MRFSKAADGIILSGIIFFVFLIIYQIVDYKTKLIGGGEFLFYYLLPVTILFFLATSLKLPEVYKINLSLSLLSIALTLYVIEGGFTLYTQLPPHAKSVDGQPFDDRTHFEVIAQLQKEGVEAVPAICPAHFLKNKHKIDGTLPLSGISNMLTVNCNEGGTYHIYNSDEQGFHNPLGLHNVENLDIVALGDSFTQGVCVASDKNMVALIRNKYANTLNLGCKGNGPLAELGALKEYAQLTKPKIVLWFYYEENDLPNLIREREVDILLSYLKEDYQQNLVLRQPELDKILARVVEKEHNIAIEDAKNQQYSLYKFLVLTSLRSELGLYSKNRFKIKDIPSINDNDLALFREVLLTAKNTSATWGGKIYFVYLPTWQRFSGTSNENFQREEVLAIVKDLEVPIIDIYETFNKQPDPLSLFPFREHGHYTINGYQIIAQTVLQSIEETQD